MAKVQINPTKSPAANYCNVCNVPLSSDDGDKNVQTHNVGKRHQLALHISHMDSIKTKNSVFVTGFDPFNVTKDSLQRFFNTYGDTKDIFLGEKNRFVIVQFTDEEVVKTLLKGRILFEGRHLSIKPRKLKETQMTVHDDKKTETTDFDKLIDALKDIQSFDAQIVKLLEAINYYDQNKVIRYRRVVEDLRVALSEHFQCRVYPFGSTVTGLDFIGSDVDVYVEAYPRFPEPPLHPDARAQEYVVRSRNILRKHPYFAHEFAVPRAKTPICKCRHVVTNINCDFNFKSKLGMCNSHLIRHYLSIDTKLLKTMIVIKAWGKIHQIIGAQGRFSPYTLTMMFIFYLQQPPINLPPVHCLQRNYTFDNMQEHWNGGFDASTPLPARTVGYMNIHQLLYGFFEYYSKFDYNLKIISPYIGAPILKNGFSTTTDLPDQYFAGYKHNVLVRKLEPIRFDTTICIQDPFELNHNTSKAVLSRTLNEFVALCKQACSICNPAESSPNLYRLFNDEIEVSRITITSNKCDFKCMMGSNLNYLKCTDEKELHKVWFASIGEFVLCVLQKVLKFTVRDNEQKATSANNKAMKLDAQNDVHDRTDSIAYHCTGKQNFWEARKSISRDLPYNGKVKQSFLEREVDLTNYISDVLCEGIILTMVVINMEVVLTPIKEGMEVSLVKKNAQKGLFESFSTYFANRLPVFIDHEEKQKNMEFTEQLATASTTKTADDSPLPTSS